MSEPAKKFDPILRSKEWDVPKNSEALQRAMDAFKPQEGTKSVHVVPKKDVEVRAVVAKTPELQEVKLPAWDAGSPWARPSDGGVKGNAKVLLPATPPGISDGGQFTIHQQKRVPVGMTGSISKQLLGTAPLPLSPRTRGDLKEDTKHPVAPLHRVGAEAKMESREDIEESSDSRTSDLEQENQVLLRLVARLQMENEKLKGSK